MKIWFAVQVFAVSGEAACSGGRNGPTEEIPRVAVPLQPLGAQFLFKHILNGKLNIREPGI